MKEDKVRVTKVKPQTVTRFGNGVRVNDYGPGKPKTVSQEGQKSYTKIK